MDRHERTDRMFRRVLIMRSALVLASALAVACAQGAKPYSYLGRLNVTSAAFPILTDGVTAGSTDLWITQFTGNPFKKGHLSVIRGCNSLGVNVTNAAVEQLSATFAWPNIVSRVPSAVLSGYHLVVPDGFLVPGKSTGNIYILDVSGSSASPVALAAEKKKWFYHMAQWRDMDGDGKLDLLTARATKPFLGKPGGELLWLKQPASDPLTNVPWEEHVLTEGPDVIFETTDLDSTGNTFEVWAAQFFTNPGLHLYRISTHNASVVSSVTVDHAMGAAEGVQAVDLNGDGRLELLANSHLGGAGGAVYAYELPDDITTGTVKRHTLASGFKVTEKGFAQAAPGFTTPFRPSGSDKGPQHILVAGDGSQEAYLLTPTGDFEYTKSVIEDAQGTVGYISAGRFLGNGGMDFVVPNYDKGYLDFFTYPQSDAGAGLRGAVAAEA